MIRVMRKIVKGEQKGFVSIFSVLIIMSILALIAVGFSTTTRRSQRRTLDNQLSTQAFYAAESGVNAAKTVLDNDPTLQKTDCQTPAITGINYNLDSNLSIGYTCLLINSDLPDARFDSVPVMGTDSPKLLNFQLRDGSMIRDFDVTWEPNTPGAGIPSSTQLLPVGNTGWGSNLGMLRIDLVPISGALDRNTLITQTYSFFLYPTSAGTTTDHTVQSGTGNQGTVFLSRCTASPCRARVTLSGGTATRYMMRLQAVYNNVKATIGPVRNIAGATVNMINGQTVIDSTGRANDVYRRIQVRRQSSNNGLTPAFALQAADTICKRLLAAPAPLGSEPDDSVSSFNACQINN
jgi:hypothetical protein